MRSVPAQRPPSYFRGASEPRALSRNPQHTTNTGSRYLCSLLHSKSSICHVPVAELAFLDHPEARVKCAATAADATPHVPPTRKRCLVAGHPSHPLTSPSSSPLTPPMTNPSIGASSLAESHPDSPFEDRAQASAIEPRDVGSASDADTDSDSEMPEKDSKSRRPPENNFTQQRLRAVNPVFTAKTVIPILFALGVVLIPLGVAMWLASHRLQDITIEYTQCEKLASRDSWSAIPEQYTQFRFKNVSGLLTPQWKLETDESQPDEDERNVCKIQFHVPETIRGPIYFFYRLKNFHQNHRRYVKSFSEDQLKGTAASVALIKDTVGLNCEPLSVDSNGKRIYPCGLIANSLFNDTYGSTLAAVNGSDNDYTMTNSGIAWASNNNRFKKTEYDYRDIVPPPNWAKKFPNGYNSTNVPDILKWEEFQNWMFTSALPDFYKLALRNNNDALQSGVYEVTIGLHFPVLPYNGKKYIFLSQRSALGGKNFFLGYSWIACGAVCIILAVSLLVVNLVKPRRAGDVNFLSWVREANERDEK